MFGHSTPPNALPLLKKDSGSSRVRFKQQGVSTVARTVESKLKEQVSAEDYGLTGEWVTNLYDMEGDTGAFAYLNGYAADNDGGGGLFYWDAISTEDDDGATVIKPTAATSGRWKRVYNGEKWAEWSGGSDNTKRQIKEIAAAWPSPILDKWKPQNSPTDDGFLSVAWSPELGLFAAVAGSGATTNAVITSPDGVNWTEQTLPLDQQWVEVIWASGPGVFVASAISGTTQRIMTSPDGVTWTARTTPDAPYRGLCWSPDVGHVTNGRLLAVANGAGGGGARVITSDDGGVTWASRTYSHADETWVSCTWAPGINLFVVTAVNTINGPVMTSPDGVTWTRQDNGAPGTHAGSNWQAVEWSPELALLCVVTNTGTAQRAYTSPDGINWTVRTTPTIDGFNPSFHDVVWIAELNQFVACANTGDKHQVMTSYDGIEWVLRRTPQNSSWEGLCWSPELGLLVAVADNTQLTPYGNHIMTCHVGVEHANPPSLLYAERVIVRQQSSEQPVNNSIVLVESDGLSQGFNTLKRVNALITLRFDSDVAADFKFSVDKISGAGTIAGQFGIVGNAKWDTSGTWVRQGSAAIGSTISVGGNGAGAFNIVQIWASFTVTGGGAVVGVKWAQDTAHASDTRVSDQSSAIYYQAPV